MEILHHQALHGDLEFSIVDSNKMRSDQDKNILSSDQVPFN